MQRVLPNVAVKDLAARLAVGLAADCDAPADGIADLLRANLPDASTLPFLAFLTSDGEWIEGASGFQDEAAMVDALQRVAKSPLLNASPAVRKVLEKHAAVASAAAERGDWKVVLGAAREAAKSTGRCAERAAIVAAEKKARDWAAAQLDAAVKEAGPGADVIAAKKRMSEVKRHFAGEPEAADVDVGLKAIARINSVRGTEAKGTPAADLRDREAAAFAGSRWVGLFKKAEAEAKADK